jgi:hypothetical protein
MSVLLIVIVLALLIIAHALVALVVWLIARPIADAQVAGARCGACGYSTRGIGGFECPECGKDLREVGMIPPGRITAGGPVPRGVLVFLWLLFSGIFGGIGVLVLSKTILPQVSHRSESINLNDPASRAYLAASVSGVTSQLQWPWSTSAPSPGIDFVNLSIVTHAPDSHSVTIQPTQGQWRQALPQPAGPLQPGPFDRAGLEQLYANAGIDPADPTVGAELDQLLQELGRLFTQQPPGRATPGTRHSARSTGRQTGFQAVASSVSSRHQPWPPALGVVLLVWIGTTAWGVLRLLRHGTLWRRTSRPSDRSES